jgi:hypothetical protein
MERGKKRLERLRRRREAAVKLFEQRERQAMVAHSLRASRQSVTEWWLAWRSGDTNKLKGATEAGWKELSVCSVLAYRWDGKRTRLYGSFHCNA